jgi:signal transduction histidine kinase
MHLGYEPCRIRLTVENFATDGEPSGVAGHGSGYGLAGMRERAELLGGELTTAMTRGGFRVELRVPV